MNSSDALRSPEGWGAQALISTPPGGRELRELHKATKPDAEELDLMPTLISIIMHSFIHSPNI